MCLVIARVCLFRSLCLSLPLDKSISISLSPFLSQSFFFSFSFLLSAIFFLILSITLDGFHSVSRFSILFSISACLSVSLVLLSSADLREAPELLPPLELDLLQKLLQGGLVPKHTGADPILVQSLSNPGPIIIQP